MDLQNSNNKINSAIETTLKNINNLIDVNTVVGNAIKTELGEYVIPISKVTITVLSGGGEYGKVGIFKKGEDLPYSAGNGAIISLKPSGFLVSENGKFKMISVADTASEKLVEKATEFINEFQRNLD